MANANFRNMSLAGGPHEWRRAIHLGWVDGQTRARWHGGYDLMSLREQIGYEVGRLHVVNVIASGLPVLAWDGSRSSAGAVEELMRQAVAMIGSPMPPEFAPDLTQPP